MKQIRLSQAQGIPSKWTFKSSDAALSPIVPPEIADQLLAAWLIRSIQPEVHHAQNDQPV